MYIHYVDIIIWALFDFDVWQVVGSGMDIDWSRCGTQREREDRVCQM
jgi:hypothetical protein